MVKEDGGKEYKKAIGIEFTLKDSNQKNKVVLKTICTNQNGDVVIEGKATVMAPKWDNLKVMVEINQPSLFVLVNFYLIFGITFTAKT